MRPHLRAPQRRRLQASGLTRRRIGTFVIYPTEIISDKAMRLIARGLAAKRLATVVFGAEHIPSQGPVLIVARHYHHLFDGLALFAAIPHRFHIVVTLDWTRNQPTKWFFATINHLARWPTLLRADAVNYRGKDPHTLFSQADVRRYQRAAMKQSIAFGGRPFAGHFPEGYPNIDPVYTPRTEPEEFLAFKPGFINIVSAAEKRLKQKIPIVSAGLFYARGRPGSQIFDSALHFTRITFAVRRICSKIPNVPSKTCQL